MGKRHKIIFGGTVAKNFLNLIKTVRPQIQEVQQIPCKIKAFICFPFGLDFQTGQTFTEMAQTVQINHRSSEEGSLHYSGSDEYGSHSPAL